MTLTAQLCYRAWWVGPKEEPDLLKGNGSNLKLKITSNHKQGENNRKAKGSLINTAHISKFIGHVDVSSIM